MTKNTGEGWKGIGDDRMGDDTKEENVRGLTLRLLRSHGRVHVS